MDIVALRYQSGFGNEFATEALAGALPVGQNSPQKTPYGLYAEQLSGTAFTAPRGANRRSWLYRIRPAAVHRPFKRSDNGRITHRFDDVEAIADAAEAGHGLAWLPCWLIRDRVRSGTLIPLLRDVPSIEFVTYALWPQTPHLPLRVRFALDALTAALPGTTDL